MNRSLNSMLRNFIRTIALIIALALILFGFISGVFPAAPSEALAPPDDSIWLLCLAGAFPLLLVYAWLPGSDRNPTQRATQDARFQHNVQQLGGFLLAGFVLISLHLLLEQTVAASAINSATVIPEAGAVSQSPRNVPTPLRVCRGSIFAGDKIITASDVISPSRFVHRVYPEPNLSYLTGYYNPTIYGSAGLEASFDAFLSGSEALDPILRQQRDILHRPVVGNDLHLTIDPALQNTAHEALGERNGAVVLLDAQSGAILAMASYPHIDPQQLSFDPNQDDWGVENKRIIDYYQVVLNDPSNPLVMRATQGLYPPGSTFKTITAAAALDTNTAQPMSVFSDTNGTIKVEAGNYVHTDCATCRPRNHGPTF